jgi:hemoglobin
MRAVRWWPPVLAAGVLIFALGSSFRADEVPGVPAMPKDRDLDKTLYRALKDVMNQGVVLYQAGDHYGCYRLFNGILLTLKPVLADQPGLQKAIDDGLAEAARQPRAWQRAWVLRRVLDNVRATLKQGGAQAAEKVPIEPTPTVKPPKVKKPIDVEPKTTETLWERLGGKSGVTKIVDDFLALAAGDKKVNVTRDGKYELKEDELEHLKKEVVDFVSSATGGPVKYTGKSMKEVHKGMGITNAEFDAAAADLKKAMKDNNVKKADIDAVLEVVETTRKDIVEVPGKKPAFDKKPLPKKPVDDLDKEPADLKPDVNPLNKGKNGKKPAEQGIKDGNPADKKGIEEPQGAAAAAAPGELYASRRLGQVIARRDSVLAIGPP